MQAMSIENHTIPSRFLNVDLVAPQARSSHPESYSNNSKVGKRLEQLSEVMPPAMAQAARCHVYFGGGATAAAGFRFNLLVMMPIAFVR